MFSRVKNGRKCLNVFLSALIIAVRKTICCGDDALLEETLAHRANRGVVALRSWQRSC
jgi:hypothetical protein